MGCNIECETNQNSIITKPNIKKRTKYNNKEEMPTTLFNLKSSSKYSIDIINLNSNKEIENNNLKLKNLFFIKNLKFIIFIHINIIYYILFKKYMN